MEKEIANLIDDAKASLNELQQRLAEAENPTDQPDQLERYIRTLVALHEFIKREKLCDVGGNWLLVALLDDLVDLQNGKRPKVLAPRRSGSQRGRPPMSMRERRVRVMCAVVMDAYMSAGLSRDRAAARTADNFGQRAKTVEGWRDRLTGPPPSEPNERQDKEIFDRLGGHCSNRSIEEIDSFASSRVAQNFIRDTTPMPLET